MGYWGKDRNSPIVLVKTGWNVKGEAVIFNKIRQV
jgi:hypothetical protein